MNKYFERLYNGIVRENPTLILMLGMCPTLAVSTRAINGIDQNVSLNRALWTLAEGMQRLKTA